MAVAKLNIDQADSATATLADAFASDPLWSWMLAQAPPEALAEMMSVLVAGALHNDAAWAAAGCDSVQLWTPPGVSELTPALEERLVDYIVSLGKETAQRMLPTFEVFERTRAAEPPHHYLGVFGTRTAKKGQGVGGAVMRAVLEVVDRDGLPAYLESSNPLNEPMYQHLGFEPLGYLPLADGTPPVRMMRRAARA